MAITSTVAKQLCTKAEFELFSESLARNVKALSGKALNARVSRARKARDKYRALANRQDREARGKQPPKRRRPAQGSAATRKKEQLFAESLARFEKQLAKVNKAAAKPTKKAAAKKSATKAKSAKRKTVKGKKKKAKTVARKKKAVPVFTPPQVKKAKKTKSAKKKSAKTTSPQTRLKASGITRKQKHRSADNRRRQARRDNK